MGQFELGSTTDGHRSAQHATGVFQHEVHHFGSDFLGGTNQVAFVLTVFVVNDNDELTFTEVCQSLLNCIQFQLFHIPYYIYTR